MPLGIDFFFDFDTKNGPRRTTRRLFFWSWQFYCFSKDVFNKTLTFEVEMDPKTDPKSD